MRTENEQELVLGNKQLLSAFFVVVALLGVFFTAGYMVGTASTKKDGSKDSSRDASANASPAPDIPQRQVAPEPPAPAPREVAEAPAEEPKPVRVKTPKAEPVAEEETAGEAVAIHSAPGHQYLQVMAVKRPEADKMVVLLKKRGLPALVGESSKPELFRVLVGPFGDTATLAKNKTTLKELGFESVISK